MTLTVTHTFASAVADDPAAASAGEVLPSHWNASHTLSGSGTLTKVDDTNVTLTLGGTPTGALINDVSITAGWTGTLGVTRGGTGTGTAFTTGSVVFADGSGVYSQDNANLFYNSATNTLQLGSGGTFSIGGDTNLVRDGAGTLALRNDGNQQVFHLYNTFTDNSNYERGLFGWNAGVYVFGTENAGTGVARNLQMIVGGSVKMDFGIYRTNAMTLEGAQLFVGQFVSVTGVGKQLVLGEAANAGSPGPAIVINSNTVAGVYGFGVADLTSQIFWFGQAGNYAQSWDTSTTASHQAHFAAFNGNLGVGQGGAVDVWMGRSASGVVAFSTTATTIDGSATILAKTKAGAPTTSDVPAGTWALIRDTTNSTTKIYYNNAGTLQTVALV